MPSRQAAAGQSGAPNFPTRHGIVVSGAAPRFSGVAGLARRRKERHSTTKLVCLAGLERHGGPHLSSMAGEHNHGSSAWRQFASARYSGLHMSDTEIYSGVASRYTSGRHCGLYGWGLVGGLHPSGAAIDGRVAVRSPFLGGGTARVWAALRSISDWPLAPVPPGTGAAATTASAAVVTGSAIVTGAASAS
jgi:hypothetical protein